MGYQREEQESTIVYDVIEQKWYVYSCYSRHINKLLKLYGDKVQVLEYEDDRPIAVKVVLDSNNITFRKARTLSEEARETRKNNIMKYNETRI